MTVLVTGASGFVGSALVDKLLTDNVSVRACHRPARNVPHRQREVVISVSIDSTTDWREALSGIDVIVHAAARVHVMDDSALDPLDEFRRVNTEGTINLARQAATAGVKRVVFISSVKVNGESTSVELPFAADDDTYPADPYALSKSEAEVGLRLVSDETGLEVVIIRSPLVYGFGVKANFASLASIVKCGIPLPLGAVTSNRRSFVGISNLVDFLMLCLRHPKAANQTFMVSDGEDLSTAELLRRMGQVMNRRVRLIPVPVILLESVAHMVGKASMSDRLLGSLRVSIEKNNLLLGWKPPFTVDSGLSDALCTSGEYTI